MSATLRSTVPTLATDRPPAELFIGGTWRPAADARRFEVEDPATASKVFSVADAGAVDARAALDAASAAQPEWQATPARERAEILRRAFDHMTAHRDDLAGLVTVEAGKPLAESLGEVAYAAEFLRWFAEEAVRIDGGYRATPEGGVRTLVMRQPVGPCYFVTPWNFPLAMGTRKIGPAFAAGCTVVIKPAEQTPLGMLALARAFEESGLPAGVLNVIPSARPAEVSTVLLEDSRLRKLSFTGSTEVGRLLLGQAAGNVVRTSMELGGNAPFLVFADADIDLAIEGALAAKLRNGGQACTAANRFYVEESIASMFARRLQERFDEVVLGAGHHPGVTMGPLIDEAGVAKVQRLVDDALERGARSLAGVRRLPTRGHFCAPQVLVDVPADALVLHEEIFGPVAPIVTFTSESEAVDAANASDFGLAAYVFTSDIDRGLRVSEQLDSGTIGLNRGLVSNPAAPFGGMKQSGLGREGGRVGIEEFLEVKHVAITARRG
jgi:succinate-semialdehyde dehydrogenase/glutarate-semialdehyde dehydrogenase